MDSTLKSAVCWKRASILASVKASARCFRLVLFGALSACGASQPKNEAHPYAKRQAADSTTVSSSAKTMTFEAPASSVRATGSATLDVCVDDERSGKRVRSAAVQIVGPKVRQTLLAPGGQTIFPDLPPGHYRLTVATETWGERASVEVDLTLGVDKKIVVASPIPHDDFVLAQECDPDRQRYP
jgi:hypothetical protein